MKTKNIHHFDICIVGSGFAGSVLSMCLKKLNYSVCLVEKEKHPRFAIGESSTPIADMVLRKLSADYDLPFLSNISRYGEWQRTFPHIGCGLKRGFSYYFQSPGEEFSGDRNHTKELLVAASFDNENSDTNWLRSDVDEFLFQKALETGVTAFEQTKICGVKRSDEAKTWTLTLNSEHAPNRIQCSWLIDATGSEKFSSTFLGTSTSAQTFKTNSKALFSHFDDVPEWFSYLQQSSSYVRDYPYHPDHSALHQLLEEGWMWMLRFNSGKLSSGIMLDESEVEDGDNAEEQFYSILRRYPSLSRLFESAKISAIPGKVVETGRLQRKLDHVYGDGWLALNHSAGFVDPLHSTGIAHTLCTVEKILDLFKDRGNEPDIRSGLMKYQESMFEEFELIDVLVSAGYLTRRHFPLFTASVMLYFVASVNYEQRRLQGETPTSYLCASNTQIKECILECYQDIRNSFQENRLEKDSKKLIQKIEQRIKPLNSVGLMDQAKNNMYRHTAVKM
jgi:FADH2 O2-dependent halogenase